MRYFDNYTGEARLRHKHFLNGQLYGVRISDPQISINLRSEKEFSFLFVPISRPEEFASNIIEGQPFEEIKPDTFERLVKCMCWKWFDNGTWVGNGDDLYRSGVIGIDDIIANREDVFEYLIAHEIDRKTAFDIVQSIMLGRVKRQGWDKATLEVLNNADVPEWYTDSCKKIESLSSRANAIMELMHFGFRIEKQRVV